MSVSRETADVGQPGSAAPTAGLPPFELAGPGPMRDQLVAAVLDGTKTATASLLAEYESDALPEVGQRWSLLDSRNQGIAVVETTEVRIVPMGEVDLQFAIDEGEGFTTVAEWRAEHERFWNAESLPTFSAGFGGLNDETLIVAERFRLVS
jgi:uncharacterized protein YhfF